MRNPQTDIIDFTLIYNKNKARIFNFVLRMVSDRMTTEDIVQSVFLKLYENMKNIQNKNSIVYWLFTTARNEVYTYYRGKKSKVDQFNVSDSNEIDVISNDDLQYEIELKELKEMILNELNEMPVEQKEVFLLKEYSGLHYDEIAGIMNIDVNLVKSRLYKVRQKLITRISKKVKK
ncbi:MAG: RNA polymerase sigma factor [Melioribacteraceae bacterium]|nr:RNA polymerase sigma factor [Melioribacteraceae bacterium]MCF8354738.1 RNA polymerase sigma factor [Melioribacteraceae bacterium]MCF8393240.1 RNA polymerase sigma factor [Melioribacteraceae bacterium]MCF8417541.1 RNA polymerase sigma factor [Melioribacteraceae bacterium]